MDRRRARAIMVCLVLLVSTLATHAQSQSSAAADPVRRVWRPVKGRYIVVLRGNDDPYAVGLQSAALHRGRLRHVYERALRGFAIEVPDAIARVLARDPRVAYVEEDGETVGTEVTEQSNVESWGLDRIDQRTPSRDGSYRYSADGTGVNVYIVDTGIRATHASFGGRVFGAYSTIGDGIPPDVDCQGHGTHVAGIVGSYDSGVAKGVTLYSVRALDCSNTGFWSDYIEALDWVATNHRKPAVLNASIGGGYISAAADAIARVVASGVTFVGAAGNDDLDACTRIPGAAAAGITVASSSQSDLRAIDSNWGSCVDVVAPGDAILSTSNSDDSSFVRKWGTSMAAPHVAGAAALYLQANPTATPAQVRAAILRSATRDVVGNAGTGTPNLLLFTPAITDTAGPALTINAPANGAIVSGRVALTAAATDDWEVTDVQFSADNRPIASDTSSPYATTWDTTGVADGAHTLSAEATDVAGNVTRRTVSVTVRNGLVDTGWDDASVGPSGTGTSEYAGESFVIDGAGTDVWGAQDSFHFVHRTWTGDGDLIVRVAALTKPAGAAFALAGLTFRESLAADARHASVVITSDGKLKFRRRLSAGGQTLSDGPAAGTTYAPKWLKLTRRGSVFTAYVSVDAIAWTRVHTAQTMTLPGTVQVGLLVLRNGGTGAARATFMNFGVGQTPAGWQNADIGAVGTQGSTVVAGGVYTLDGGGTDLWSTEDGAQMAFRPWNGDGEIIARIDHVVKPDGSEFGLAGVTMRETLDANSRHASMVLTTTGKAKFRRRNATGSETVSDGPSTGSMSIPKWLRLKRSGQLISAFVSDDGATWTQIHTAVSSTLPPTVYVGLISLRSGGTTLASAQFSNVVVK